MPYNASGSFINSCTMEKYSKTFSVDEIPDLSDKVIIITGSVAPPDSSIQRCCK